MQLIERVSRLSSGIKPHVIQAPHQRRIDITFLEIQVPSGLVAGFKNGRRLPAQPNEMSVKSTSKRCHHGPITGTATSRITPPSYCSFSPIYFA